MTSFRLTFAGSGLWEALIDILCQWVKLGVDGFRCDVGWVVPIEFWKRARSAVQEINPDVVWLCETWFASGVEST
jgi:glycosidase